MAASRLGRRGDERLEARGRRSPCGGRGGGPARRRRRRRPRSAGAPRRRTGSAPAVGGERPRRRLDRAAPVSSRSRVSCLASSTLGWSNGSMPRTAPAIAVATSQRHELGAEVDRVGEVDPDDRVAGGLEGVGERVASAVRPSRPGRGGRTTRSVPYVGDGAERLEVDRHDPDAVLAGALGDELLDPRPEAARSRRRSGRSACRARPASVPMARPSETPGLRRRVRLAAGAEHRRAEASSASRSSPISDAGTRPT